MTLVEVGDLFRDCVRRREALGLPRAEAERFCRQPTDLTPGSPQAGGSASGGAPAPLEACEPSGGTRSRSERAKGVRGRSEARIGQVGRGYSRWMGRDLTPGFVPGDRDAQAEARVWAREMLRVGQRPPFNREGWEEHARRMGMSPDQVETGWIYIATDFSQKAEQCDRAVASLRKALGESSTKWPAKGYNMPLPGSYKVRSTGPGGASFPFYTKAGEKVFRAAQNIIAGDPDIGIDDVYQLALARAGVGGFELTPEDDAIMGIAIQWEITRKGAPKEPPTLPDNRAASGWKGTQIGYGREMAPRGAP